MMNKKSLCAVILCGLFLFIPTLVGAQQEVPGVSKTEVVIGISTPLSGPAALWGVTAAGAKAWADYINDQGGVHGRKIKVIMKDDGYNAARALINLQQMKGKVFAVCGLLGTAILNASRDYFPDNKIPLINAYGDIRIWTKMPPEKRKYIFIAYPDYEDEAAYIARYAIQKLNTKKIALFYQNDDYGKMALSGIKKTIAALTGKATLVGSIPHEVTERALGMHALKLKETGADTLIIYATMTHASLILKEAAKVGYRPKAMTTFTLGDPIMYKLAGDVWEGTYTSLPGNSGVPGSEPEADKVAAILKKYDPKIEGKEYLALFGAMSMIQLVEGLKNAGPGLTPESMIKGMEMIKDWKPQGIGAPVTYGPERRHGVNASRMGQARDGRHMPLEPFTIHKSHF
ncbi:ABC transporter substrate-binding protein [candidate division CSSED10-310 bacterium]|uniref:ABC transporter substrate-binding protein n=1 Tax=candidate division CSSED10-310 bacterium TaxID=2855610 RepID=A0ABV6YSI3_UNCC1